MASSKCPKIIRFTESASGLAQPVGDRMWINEIAMQKSSIKLDGEEFNIAGLACPHNETDERQLIGEILSAGEIGEGNALFRRVCLYVKHEDFYFTKYSIIFASMERVVARDDPLDIQSVANDLESRKGKATALTFIGGKDELQRIANVVPLNTDARARNILRLSVRRDIILMSHVLGIVAQDDKYELLEMLSRLNHMKRELQSRYASLDNSGVYKTMNSWEEYIATLEDTISDPAYEAGILIWLTQLQNTLKGWQRERLYTIAAGTNMGKSTFLMNAALAAAIEQKKRVVFITLETSGEQLIERLLGLQANISGQRIQTRTVNPDERERLRVAKEIILTAVDEYRLRAVEMDMPSMSQLQGRIDDLYYEQPFDILFIDYLGIETTTYEKVYPNERYDRKTHADQIWIAAGNMRKVWRVPIVTATQINRQYHDRPDKRPVLTDIADSSLCEKRSDAVIFLHRMSMVDSAAMPNLGDLTVAKNRMGPAGQNQRIEILFDEYTGRIDNWTGTAKTGDEVEY
jgi:replicative DNA helicase